MAMQAIELDDNNEATGTAHFFCCAKCLPQFDDNGPAFQIVSGDEGACPGTRCETCGERI